MPKLKIRRLKFWIFVFVTLVLFGHWSLVIVSASHCPSSDYDCQITEIQKEIDALSPAHQKNKEELSGVKKQLDSLGKRIEVISSRLLEVEANISKREEELAYSRRIFEEKTNSHYKFLRLYDPLLPFFASENASEAFREINFRQKAAEGDRQTIEKYAKSLFDLKTDKDALVKNKEKLALAKKQADERAKFLTAEVAKVETYIATLTGKQQELSALKSGGFQTSVGDTPLTLEPCSGPPGSSNFCDPGFRPAFGAFSFGAPHRTGMSQYGAYGRSKLGQSAETILSAYYQGAELKKDYASPDTIGVNGHGRIPFEDNYLLGIYEVPESWGDKGGFEALKAQAVAARSYALYATEGGKGSICTTEACQVYKPQLKSGKWAEAVRATKGWVLTKNGNLVGTYYASTSGGYTISQWGWSGIKDAVASWPDTAYEKVAESPWFYKGWYKSRGGASCGRNQPWLTSEELADILNAWTVLTSGGGDASRISPLDTSCWSGNPYLLDDLKSIGGYTSVSNVSVIYSNEGSTQSISFSTNKGQVSVSGGDFKKAFNLRAPGYIGLKSSLYNIEKL